MEHCVCVQERQAFDVRIQTARDKPNNKILERDKLINGTNLGSEDLLHMLNAQNLLWLPDHQAVTCSLGAARDNAVDRNSQLSNGSDHP